MDFDRVVSTCYPNYRDASAVIKQLTLSHRSLLIKSCQAQMNPTDPSSTLFKLQNIDVTYILPRTQGRTVRTHKLYDVLPLLGISLTDPCEAAIVLDILRGAPVTPFDYNSFRFIGWTKEIDLSHALNSSHIDFDYFFNLDPTKGPHPFLPENPFARTKIYKTLWNFRAQYAQRRPLLYSRYTHKNMSFQTRREYERSTKISLEGAPIFGQDDWIRHYHETGECLEGSIEMRQKWYPSNAKPRTYFAQGGTAYTHSRFLQDFFTLLTNIFPTTNHITRLQPYRLRLPTEGHYLIYDLSSFTSNMQAQRNFCDSLARFFKGVEVDIFDEYYGIVPVDLGEMLEDYNEHCVDFPVLNQDRVPSNLKTEIDDYQHRCASMLGIYGNLMTCTIAHFLIISGSLEDVWQDDNTAGDDGMILYFLFTYYSILMAISLVGTFAMDKTFDSSESGAIALKRPVYEESDPLTGRAVRTKDNIIPPNLLVSWTYLSGYNVDPRFVLLYGDAPNVADRISIVGKDLSRFLVSCYNMNYDSHLVRDVYVGFTNLVRLVTDHTPVQGGSIGGIDYVWPVDVRRYSFLDHDPLYIFSFFSYKFSQVFPRRGYQDIDDRLLRDVGDEVVGNSGPWLTLMVTLGYLERSDEQEMVTGSGVLTRLYIELASPSLLQPLLYEYRVVKQIPARMYLSL